jgi:hypothetical protein
MFKRSIILVLLVLGILGLAIFLVGFTWKGGKCGRGHKNNKDAIVKRMDSMVKDLNLSQEQNGKFEELKKKMTENMDKGPKMNKEHKMDSKDSIREEMITELKKDTPDVKLLADKAKENLDQRLIKEKERMEIRTANTKECVDLFVNFYNMLDDNQKKILVQKVHKKIGAMETLRED